MTGATTTRCAWRRGWALTHEDWVNFEASKGDGDDAHAQTPDPPCTGARAYAGGKHTSEPRVQEVRLIAPQSSLGTILDAYVAAELDDLIDERLGRPSEFFEGARPQTQTLDISHAMSMIAEKGSDMMGGTAVCSADIKQFFDNTDVLRALQRLRVREARLGLAKAVLVDRSCRALRVSIGSSEACISARPVGALTGSRTAMSLGRLPTVDVVRSHAGHA